MGFDNIYVFFGYLLTDEEIKTAFSSTWEKMKKKTSKEEKENFIKNKYMERDDYTLDDHLEQCLDEYMTFEFSDDINKSFGVKNNTLLKNGEIGVFHYPCCFFVEKKDKPRWILGYKVDPMDLIGVISIPQLEIAKKKLETKLKEFNIKVTGQTRVHITPNDCASCS